MTASLEMRPIDECSVTGCSYNDHSSCHAHAITIGGSASDASCATFIPLGSKGGLASVHGSIGACQRAECTHNASLECTASSVKIGAGASTADCLTYQPS